MNLAAASYLKQQLASKPGYKLLFTGPTFNEFAIEVPGQAAAWRDRLAEQGILAGIPLQPLYPERFGPGALLLCATELHTKSDIDRLVSLLG